MTNLTKSELRTQARDVRNGLNPDIAEAEKAAQLFWEHLNPPTDKVIAAYWPVGREFDVRPIMDDLLKSGHKLALPVCPKGKRVMKFVPWHDGDELVQNAYRVPEPKIDEQTEYVLPDILLMPMLAFDRRGYRLGQGGGHYDATLAHLRSEKEVLAVGVGYGEQAVLFNLPIEDHDQKLDMVITPGRVFDYR